ncbi:SatD family protein [Knoellia remsis]|uniref:SatD family protein n=1 Tax=Knoellia remsis TaxID=407159 RepID=A0A2T0UDR2_9MICO|nr:SatD family protein [Knoellia remsis]PRY56059.1 SatD family protein [Knoellia remsis]
MSEMKPSPVVLIGDVVASRAAGDRSALHRELERALARTNERVTAVEPLEVTVGDEFQGVYATLGAALDAALRTRLALRPTAETRYGLGRGDTTTLDADRGIKDGPGWWAARDAIVEVEELAGRAAFGHVHTAYRIAEGKDDPHGLALAVEAALDCQDHMVGSLSERSGRLLEGLLDGMTQRELAQAEDISPSAVSQRVRADGLAVLVRSAELLRELP